MTFKHKNDDIKPYNTTRRILIIIYNIVMFIYIMDANIVVTGFVVLH